MTKQLQVDHAVVSAKQLRVSAVSMVSLKRKFVGVSHDRAAQNWDGVVFDYAEVVQDRA